MMTSEKYIDNTWEKKNKKNKFKIYLNNFLSPLTVLPSLPHSKFSLLLSF